MPRVKIDYIVSFSSEDSENPASNLLAWDVSKKKWLCSKGEPSCSVVLQLNKAVKISSVNIGAYQSALVEVLVGRSESPNEPFQVLVPSSVFQSPSEARRGAAPDADRVRSFPEETLAAPARDQRWDRLRVVCSQPYNKHCKFGISFVHVFSAEGSPPPPAPEPAATPAPAPAPALIPTLATFSSDEEEFRPGELFVKHLSKNNENTDTGAQIRQATSQALKNIPDSSIKLTKTPIGRGGPSLHAHHPAADTRADSDSHRQRNSLMYTPEDDRPHHKIDRVVDRHNEQKKKDDDKKYKQKNDDKTSRLKNDDQSDKTRDSHNNSVTQNDKQKVSERSKDDRHRADRPPHKAQSRDSKRLGERASTSGGQHREAIDNRKGDKATGDIITDESRKRTRSDKNSDNDGSLSLVAGPVSSSPHLLLRDVVFVLSGYVNPRRAALRTAALSLGATCRQDWGPDCTHLISLSLVAGPVSSSPYLLLRDVVFVLSGYVNPRRAALALGATCRQDWGPDCTHLICAFPNTPKLRAVRAAERGARAVVVRGEWVEHTARTRRRLPARWFATEPARRVSPPPGWDSGEGGDHTADECDTDDEIERVRNNMKKQRTAPPATPSPAGGGSPERAGDLSAGSDVMFLKDERIQDSVTLVETDSCGGSTDEEGQRSPSPPSSPAPPGGALPALFSGRTFTVCSGSERRASLIERYLRAYGGQVVQDGGNQVDYVVCDSSGAGRGRVHCAWVWRCHRARRLEPPDRYTLTH